LGVRIEGWGSGTEEKGLGVTVEGRDLMDGARERSRTRFQGLKVRVQGLG